jgi:PAS domain S-box-containing protein
MNMQSYPIRVLLIDDDEDDYAIVRGLLSDFSSAEFTLEWISDYGAALGAILSGDFHVCLLDYVLQERNGLELMQEAVSLGALTPIIILTGRGDYDLDVEAMSKGAADWLTKVELSEALLERSIRHAMERQRKKMELIKAKRIIQALSESNHAVIHCKDETELLCAICRIVVEVGGYRMAWVGYAEDDRDRTVRPVANYGYEENYLKAVNITWKDTKRGRGPAGTCIRTGIPSVIRSIGAAQGEFESWRREALNRGYASVICLPLFLDEQRLGTLCIYSSETDAFDTEEVEFLVKLSGNLSYGIGVLRLREARKSAEALLIEANLSLEKRVEDRTAELIGLNAELRKEAEERSRTEEALKKGERKFRAIFDQTFQLMGLLTVDGILIEANRNALQFAGIEESEVTDKPFWETPWWTHSSELQDTLRAAVKKAAVGECVRFESVHFAADGSPHVVDVSLKSVTDETGGVCFLIAEARDIDVRKRAEQALRDSETKLRAIAESARDAILMMDTGGLITYWNPAAELIFGYTKEEVAGKNLHELLAPQRYHEAHKAAFPRFVETGQGEATAKKTLELMARRKDGAEIPVELSLSAVFLNGWQAVGLLRDITERKRAEEAIIQSQQQLADIIDFLPDATFVIDRDGKVIAWNRAMQEMMGIGAAAMLGMGGYEYALPFYGERRPILIDLVLKQNEEIEAKYLTLERNGSVLAARSYIPDLRGREAYLFGTASALYDSRGNVVGAIESIRDITGQKRMEEAVRRAEEKYRDIFENSVTGIFQTSPEGRILSVNFSIASMLGYDSPEDMLDSLSDVRQLYARPERRSEMLRLIEEHGWVRDFEVEYFRKDKSVIWVSLNIRAVRNATGEIAYLEGTVSDITDGKLLRVQLDQAQKMEAIGTLAGGIAHDFNNILAPIIGYTELSLNIASEDSKLGHNLKQVLLSANRAKDLVRQILTFSRKTEPGNKPVQVSLIVKEVLKLLRSSLPSTIDISQFLHPDAFDSTTMADPTQIHQVLMNLCTNAAHAMHAKGGKLSITLENVKIGRRAGRGTPDIEPGPYLRLSVTDTGHGMSEAVSKRIFDPYFTTKGPNEGTGLGLAVVYGIVKNLSGAIAVSSEPGKGSTFDVYFPRIQMIQTPLADPSEFLPTGYGAVLAVDDEKFIVDMVKEMLETLGYVTIPRYSSTDALAAFKARPESFDLVITDMTMPHMTGIDLAREILTIRPRIPIILCTGFSETVDEQEIKEMGIRELLMKPVSMRDLALAVHDILAVDKPVT